MTTPANQYNPDYVVPPGWVLNDYLETRGISQAEFARRCGRSPKLISEIIAGEASLTPETALQFEKVLGLSANVWLGIESNYRLHQAQAVESRKALEYVEWSKTFPISELVNRGIVETPSSDADAVSKLLSYFGVASVDACQAKFREMRVAYRHSPSFDSDPSVLETWLRLGELEAVQEECAGYSKTELRQALGRIRELTREPFNEAIAEAEILCRSAGVALVCVKPFSNMALSGAARWLLPHKALIQLSARHKTDDHLWFSLFHEAAHILFHSKQHIHIDSGKGKITELDAEADKWATNFLISPGDWKQFSLPSRFSKAAVRNFAAGQGISPSIVVGRLQHDGKIPWNYMNDLKTKLKWKCDT